ncbi:catalase family protein [uncultured Jannaschia sp.]|uniref:catalase family protein n=1 Tax=uncultured Jannaschia sp. TaxID=293347 RepID=UPI00260B5833|nr:catalase family protein [uncultured Jannaschia sp.]
MKEPVLYSENLETPSADERETIEELNATFDTILDRVAEDEGHAYRSVHAKSHGLIEATVTIPDDLPPEYAQGIFARGGRYGAILRISTNPGDILDDSVSVPRGLALKVLDIEGKRLPGSESARSQDFVMVNGPAFSAPDAAGFLKSLKLLARTTDRAEWAKKALSTVLRGVESGLEATTGPSAKIETLGGAPNVHPLGETYFTQTPYRFGDHVAKVQLVPVSDNLTRLTGETVDTSGRSDALREEIDAVMQAEPSRWELRVQLCRDTEAQPVEDASVPWDEDISPFVTVATVDAGQQPAWTEGRARAVDDGMRFAPWIGIEAHRPLGSVNRARKATYDHSAAFRSRVNGCPIHDPRKAALPA